MTPMPVWPVMMYDFQWPEHEQYQQDLKQLCRDLEQANSHSGVAPDAKRGLYESRFDFCDQEHAAVKAWTAWCKQCVFEAAVHSCGQYWPQGVSVIVEFHESWCHITRDGGYHDVHIHPNSSWSAIYYLDCGDMSMPTRNGVNRFFRPYNTSYSDGGQAWMTANTTIDIAAEPGQLIVFPSWIQHSALPYRGEQERYILSFNSKVRLAE
jgi:uncharacterized protein (TIGR02466 family)